MMIARQYFFGNDVVYDLCDTLQHITLWAEEHPNHLGGSDLTQLQTQIIDMRYQMTICDDTLMWCPLKRLFVLINEWFSTWGKVAEYPEVIELEDLSVYSVPDHVIIDLTVDPEPFPFDERWIEWRGDDLGDQNTYDTTYSDAIQDAIEEEEEDFIQNMW